KRLQCPEPEVRLKGCRKVARTSELGHWRCSARYRGAGNHENRVTSRGGNTVGSAMREKELRIALVCFDGISLAIYMHGIRKEVLKLVRASAALHDIDDRNARRDAHFFDHADAKDPEYDTEDIYFDLLREIGRTLELRVVVDVIAGASAGGINGAML